MRTTDLIDRKAWARERCSYCGNRGDKAWIKDVPTMVCELCYPYIAPTPAQVEEAIMHEMAIQAKRLDAIRNCPHLPSDGFWRCTNGFTEPAWHIYLILALKKGGKKWEAISYAYGYCPEWEKEHSHRRRKIFGY